MGPIKEKKFWTKTDKKNKEDRKKWKEKNVIQKIEKEKLKKAKTENNLVNQTKDEIILEDLSTISIAVPGSILENAQSPELRTYLAGQIARAACIFQVDEIVVFDDYANAVNAKKSTLEDIAGTKTGRQCCIQLGRILQYLECPQYLRKFFFPIHKDLKFAGILNPLDAPHHLRVNNEFEFREGIVTNKPVKPGRGSLVNVGLLYDVQVDKLLTENIRCTVKILPQIEGSKKLKGVVVAPSVPRKQTGIYWGYSVRLANSLSEVFSQCPYKEGYDVTIGTSDKGAHVMEFNCPLFKHLLIMFGGLHGLESALESDDKLKADDPKLLFDYYLNTVPNQGSRTIRTEEAILVSLATLQSKFNPEKPPKPFQEYEKIATSSGELKDSIPSKQLNKVAQTSLNKVLPLQQDLDRFD